VLGDYLILKLLVVDLKEGFVALGEGLVDVI